MKKSRIIAVILALVVCVFSVFVAGCASKISSPIGFSIDEENRLSWREVDEARSYIIEIKNADGGDREEKTSRRPYYSLAELEMGDYEIRVKSVGSGAAGATSAWSSVIYFHKDYETGCIYELINNNTEYAVKKVGTASDKVVFDEYYRGKPLTTVQDSAFRNNSKVTEIEFGNQLKYIGDRAFFSCSKLTTITIPDSVEYIGVAAFQSCGKLESIELPEKLTSISDSAFAYCRTLDSIDLKNVITIGTDAFYGCSTITSVNIPDSVKSIDSNAFSGMSSLERVHIGSGVIVIWDHAFYGNESLKEVSFSENSSLRGIDDYTFAKCEQLVEVNLPDGLEVIDNYAFHSDTNLERLTIPETVTAVGAYIINGTKMYIDSPVGDYIYADKWVVGFKEDEGHKLEKIVPASGTDAGLRTDTFGIAAAAFYMKESLTTVNLPASVKYIQSNCFRACSNLWSFSVEKGGLLYIGALAFGDSSYLRVLDLGDSLKTIDERAFFRCELLDNSAYSFDMDNGRIINSFIPDTVTSIGTQAFEGTKLASENAVGLEESGNLYYAGNWVVGYYSTETYKPSGTLRLRSGTVGIGNYAFYGLEGLQTLNGTDSVRYVCNGAFYNCKRLANVSLNNNLQEINSRAFYGCSSLFSVDLPVSLKSIGSSAFYKCTTLSEIDLSGCPDLKTIGSNAFYACTNLKSVNFGDTVESIGNYAFAECSALTEIAVPASVKTIGVRAFMDCYNLATLNLSEGLESIGDYAFKNCMSLYRLNIPDSVKSIGNFSFYRCSSLSYLTLGKVQSIGNYAFSRSAIRHVALPGCLQTLGESAFKNCNNLQSVVIPSAVVSLGNNAFYVSSNATIYTDAATQPENWYNKWNSGYKPVVQGSVLSEDGDYIVSLTITESTFLNIYCVEIVKAKDEEESETGTKPEDDTEFYITNITAPKRTGHTFLGWATTSGATTWEYTTEEIAELPVGTTVYTVWSDVEEEYALPDVDTPGSGFEHVEDDSGFSFEIFH